MNSTSAIENARTKLEKDLAPRALVAGYNPKGAAMPIGGYAILAGAYLAGLGAFLRLGRKKIPRRIAAGDLALLGVATHKLTRIITRDWVTSPLRAPFTEYKSAASAGEVNETSRGEGLRRAVGDLLTCPWCMGPWVATGLAAGLVFAPHQTRLVAGIFVAVTASDYLHHVYRAATKLGA